MILYIQYKSGGKMNIKRYNKYLLTFTIVCLLFGFVLYSQVFAQFGTELNTPHVYKEDDYEFSFTYPSGWTEEVLINDLERKEGVILKRIEIKNELNTDGFIVDIFPIEPEVSLLSWFVKHEQQFTSRQNMYDLSSTIDGAHTIYTFNPSDLFPRHTFLIKHGEIIIRFDYEPHKIDIFSNFVASIESINFNKPTGNNLNRLSSFFTKFQMAEESEITDQVCCGYSDPNPNHYACGRTGNCVWWAKYKRPDTGGTATNSWGNASNWGPRARQEGFPVNNTPAAGTVACWAPLGQNHVSYVESFNPSTSIAAMSDMDWESSTHGCIAEFWNQRSNIYSLEYIYPKPIVVIPGIPTGLSASDGTYTDRIQLNWSAVSGATSYQVFRATSSTGARTHIATPSSAAHTDTSITPGATYWYWVKACNSAGCSDYSAADTGYARIPIPGIPTGIIASDGTFTDRVQVTWNPVSVASNYQVYRADSATGNKTLLGTTASSTYNDFTAIQGNTYWYWVKACNTSGCSDYSSADTGYALLPVPSAPTGLTASDGTFTDRVELTWDATQLATSYQVHRATSETGTKTQLGSPTSNSFTDTIAVQGTTYWYWVKACNASGCSDFSANDTGYALLPIPVIPSGVNATDGTYTDRVDISWNASDRATGYQVFRSETVAGEKIQIGTPASNGYSDMTITPGTTYWYWIKSCNSSGCSDFSQGDTGYAMLPIPDTPTGLNASDGTFADRVELTWQAVNEATYYDLYRADSISGTKTLIGSIFTTNFTDFNAVVNTIYWYWVKACNSTGCSDFSIGDSGYSMYQIPSIPSNVNATDGDFSDRVEVIWDAVPDTSDYKVYRALSQEGTRALIGTIATNSFIDNNAIVNTTYWYWIQACNLGGCSDFSLADSGYAAYPVPGTPQNLLASDGIFPNRVEVTWNEVSETSQYQVFRAESETGTRTLVGNANDNRYDDFSALHNKIYSYWVKACNVSGCSDYSLEDSGYLSIDPPDSVMNVKASDGSYLDRVEITWSSSPQALDYEIYRALSQLGVKNLIGTVSMLHFDDYDVELGVTYWYWIKACNIIGCSAFSKSDSGFSSNMIYQQFIPYVLRE